MDLPDLEKVVCVDDVEVKSSLLKCDICTKLYGETEDEAPRLLLCGHTFCTKDLKALIKDFEIECPVCSQPTPIAAGKNITDSPQNSALLELVKAVKQAEFGTLCGNCEKNPSSLWCPSCQGPYCSDCSSKFHLLNKILKRHKPVPLQDRSDVKCESHSDEFLALFCLTCKMPICHTCASKFGEHAGHEVALTDEEEDAQRQILKQFVAELQKHKTKMKTDSDEAAKKVETLAKSKVKTEEAIIKELGNIINAVQDRKKELLLQLKNKVSQETTKFHDQRKGLASLIAQSEIISEEIVYAQDRTKLAMLLKVKVVTERCTNTIEDITKFKAAVGSSIVSYTLQSDQLLQQIARFGEVGLLVCPKVDITSTEQSGSTCTITWKPETDWTFGFEFQHCKSADGIWSNCVRTDKLEHRLTNLETGLSYDFRVRTIYEQQEVGGWSDKTLPVIRQEGQSHKGSFKFTNLGTKGPKGPLSTDGYVNTSLNGEVTLVNGIQHWKVPFSGTFSIEAAGACGGNHNNNTKRGGFGAVMKGLFELKEDQELSILTGQKGWSNPNNVDYGGGGGGGTFVVDCHSGEPLIVAGGGAGSGDDYYAAPDAGIAAGTHQKSGQDAGNIKGGRDGNGGQTSGPSGGGGFLTDGAKARKGYPGKSFKNGGVGGEGAPYGGFGCGGNSYNGGGGGGGYSGGAGCDGQTSGGGGSFNAGTDQNNRSGVCHNNGYVVVTYAEG